MAERVRAKQQRVVEKERAVLAFLARNGASDSHEVAELIGSSYSGTYALLRRMEREGALVSLERGLYDLAAGYVPAPASAPQLESALAKPVAPVSHVLMLPVNRGEHKFAVKLDELAAALRHIQGIELFPRIELLVAATHIERAADWIRGNARPQLHTPLGEEPRASAAS